MSVIKDNSSEKANVTNSVLLDTACELNGAAESLHDLSVLLHAIHTGKLKMSQIISLTRTMQLTCETWANLLDHDRVKLETIVGRTVNG